VQGTDDAPLRRLTEMQVSSPAHWILRSSFLSLPSEVCVSIVFNVLATVADRLKSSPMFHSGNRALAINSPRRGNMLTTGINHDKAKFEPAAFLASAGLGKKVVDLKPDETFFCQGDKADSVFYLQRGRAKLTVVSHNGKEATITLLAPGEFVGEESLAAILGRVWRLRLPSPPAPRSRFSELRWSASCTMNPHLRTCS